MKYFVLSLFSLFSIGIFAQEPSEIAEEFIPIEVEGKEAFISTKTGEYTYRAHAETDATQLKTTASGVIYADITMHTVKKGETLSSIAKKNGVTISDLKQHNKVSASNLKLGSQLKVVKKMLVKSSSPVKGTSGEERIIARLRPGESPGALAPPPPIEEIQKKLVKTEKTTEKAVKPAYKVKTDIKNPILGLGNSDENSEVKNSKEDSVNDVNKRQRLARLKAEMKALEEELEKEVIAEEIRNEVVVDLSPYKTADEEVKIVEKELEVKEIVEKEEIIEIEVEETVIEEAVDAVEEAIEEDEMIEKAVNYTKTESQAVVKEENGKKVMVFENKSKQKEEETTAEKASRLINEVRKTKVETGEVKVEKEIAEITEEKTLDTDVKDSEESEANYYTVAKGNSLWSIARKHNMSVDELKKLNNLKSNYLNIGQKLKVKSKK